MVFCCPAHQIAFHNRSSKRGRVVTPFLQMWRTGKRGRTELTAYALAQLSMLADKWNAEDRAAGRRPDVLVNRRKATNWSAADLD